MWLLWSPLRWQLWLSAAQINLVWHGLNHGHWFEEIAKRTFSEFQLQQRMVPMALMGICFIRDVFLFFSCLLESFLVMPSSSWVWGRQQQSICGSVRQLLDGLLWMFVQTVLTAIASWMMKCDFSICSSSISAFKFWTWSSHPLHWATICY